VTTVAQEPAVDADRFSAHLTAGEFGLAAKMARGTNEAGRRDAWLGQVAGAQARAGSRWASSLTAYEIGDDSRRNAAFGEIAERPFGGTGARGGAAMADFDSLIELITSTIAPDSWDAVGGPGAVEPFPGGVLVDGAGLLRRIPRAAGDGALEAIWDSARRVGGNRDASRASRLRKVSLSRLERHAARLWACGKRPDETMKTLAGLRKVDFVLVYPETRDIVLAGPAGDWKIDWEGRRISTETGRPVLSLDDLVVVLRNAMSSRERGRFGCSITPRQENLASLQAFLKESANRSLRPRQREGWLNELRQRLGRQDIQITGIDPRSRAARIIVEADYHMKLIGMGLEQGTLGVASCLDRIQPAPSGATPPLDVLRWWFTLNYEAILTSKSRDAFEIRGPGVKVLSENELLADSGRRVHTGKSKECTAEFAHSFTRHFASLAAKYPIYAELQNLFDLALVSSLIRSEHLGERIGWQMEFLLDDGMYQVDRGLAPTEVESVINHRVVDGTRILVGVSGGVQVDASQYVRSASLEEDDYGLLRAGRNAAAPSDVPPEAWWWD